MFRDHQNWGRQWWQVKMGVHLYFINSAVQVFTSCYLSALLHPPVSFSICTLHSLIVSNHLDQGRATSGPRAISGPWRPGVWPVTLPGINTAIRPAKPKERKCQTASAGKYCLASLHSSPHSARVSRSVLLKTVCPFWDLVVLFNSNKKGQAEAVLLWGHAVRVCDLQQEIATFLRQKNLPHSGPQWLVGLALLTDITGRRSPLSSARRI